MRAPSSLLVVVLIGLAAGCSRGKPVHPSHLDLVLDGTSSRAQVVSAVELGNAVKPQHAAAAPRGVDAPLHAHRKARTHHFASVPRRAPGIERTPALARSPQPQPPVAVAHVPAPVADPAPAPAPDPSSQPSDQHPGHGGGGWSAPTDGGVRFPGFPGGGVIIIRGGHGGADPCDEHGRGGIGGFPGLPGRIGGGFPGGGIRFLRAR